MPVLLRKKPIEVQAVQWKGDNYPELKAFVGEGLSMQSCRCIKEAHDRLSEEEREAHATKVTVVTKEGAMRVVEGAYVVRGVGGEFYPVDPSVFDDTFETLGELDDNGKLAGVSESGSNIEADDHVTEADERHWDAMEGLVLAVEALSAGDRKDLASSDFALPKERRYPIHNAKHVKLAWRMLNAGNLTGEEKATAKRRILARAKEFDIDVTGWAKANEDLNEPFVDQSTPMDVIPYLWNQSSEEASETGQAAAKCVRFGHTGIDPKTGISAVDRYVSEMNDQLGLVVILNEELSSRGLPLITGIGDAQAVHDSVEKRKNNLYNEYKEGRFTIPTN